MPDAAIGADVMVGFPGETDEEFEQSRQFIENLPFTYLHVFTYSERPGTPAAESRAVVPIPVRKERNRILRDLAARKHNEFLRSMIGRELDAVTLDGDRSALTDNFLKVRLAAPQEPRKSLRIKVIGVEKDYLIAGN
jgi:threonylcarbamoyladenosine tRNA methylthiotransferase MtaB